MTVKPAVMFGKGLRLFADIGRWEVFTPLWDVCERRTELDAFVEFTLKDDERNDPPMSEDALHMLGILTREEYKIIKDLTGKVCNIIKELAKKDIELYDIKLEFGKIGERPGEEQIALIDEISGDMRAYKDGKYIEPLQLERLVLTD